jgi:orotate phosphoribosyltransferase
MSAREELKSQIIKKAVVHGKVILSSGKEADYYVDLRRVTLDHVAAPLVGEVMLDLTKDLDFEAVRWSYPWRRSSCYRDDACCSRPRPRP